jgi:2,3-dimethylmalate lyase
MISSTIAERRMLFKQRLQQPGIVTAPGCYDAFSAKLAASIGFEALYMSGAGVSAALGGVPDVGLLTMTEMLEQARRIVDVTDIPIISDADTGYGGILNVMRTVRQFESAGVCAIHIEDQQFPKKCGHLEGKRVIAASDMVNHIKATVDARTDPNFLIIARTDALAVHGMDDALSRARQYADAGADILFVEAPEGIAQVEEVAKALSLLKPLLLNRGGAEKTPPLSASEAERMGFKIIIFPGDAQKAAGHAMLNIYKGLKKNGNNKGLATPMMSFEDRFEILGMSEVRRLEKKFSK